MKIQINQTKIASINDNFKIFINDQLEFFAKRKWLSSRIVISNKHKKTIGIINRQINLLPCYEISLNSGENWNFKTISSKNRV